MTIQAERLGPPFARSLVVHALIFGSLIGWQLWNSRQRERWGDPNAVAGGSVTITPTATIPIPQREGPVNPVANDTESDLPLPPKEAPKPQEKKIEDDPDAVALKLKREKKKLTDVAASNQRYRSQQPAENQLTSNVGQRAKSEMFAVKGTGGVGTGTGTVFGVRLGWYEALIRERVGSKWSTTDIDARVRFLPEAIVTFTIQRNGTVGSVKIVKSSGNYALDTSAQKAVYDASPLPPLPREFERDSATIEFWFELKR